MSLLSERIAAAWIARSAQMQARDVARIAASLPVGASPPPVVIGGSHFFGGGTGSYLSIEGASWIIDLPESSTPYVFAVDHRSLATFQDSSVFAPVFKLPSGNTWTPALGDYTEDGVTYQPHSGAVVVGGVTLTSGEGFAVELVNTSWAYDYGYGSPSIGDLLMSWTRSGFKA
jgi:hypothetical protein